MSLTDTKLKSLKATGKTYEIADRDGLSVRVSPKGAGTFQFRYRFLGKQQRMRIGSYPDTLLKEARERTRAARALLEHGLDPITQARLEKSKQQQASTVKELCVYWLENYGRPHRARSDEIEQVLEKNVYKQVGSYPLESVSRRDIVNRVLKPILDRGSRVQANKVLTLLKQIFAYGVEHGLLEASPSEYISKKNVGGREIARDRVLTDSEIHTVWTEIDASKMSEPVKLAVKILLATGQRRGELTNARWLNVDLGGCVWVIPAENSKNGKEHRVPLSSLAVELFKQLKTFSTGSGWVMPSVKHDDQPMSERVISRAVNRWQTGESDRPVDKWIDKFTPHDLRRTAATKMNGLGVSPHVVEKVLNHTMGGVMAVYNRYDYWPEMVEALNTWGNALEALTSGNGNVVLLKNKGAV